MHLGKITIRPAWMLKIICKIGYHKLPARYCQSGVVASIHAPL
jgi:hypothetical protein